MRFAVNGVTLIYGPNASGKSGYCRITKQLCRSLSPGALRGNVYDGGQPPPPEVGVAFRVGGDDDPKTELTWRSTDPPPAELARMSVFDTASARVYVDKERKIEFLPYELDLLNKLGLAARALDREFKGREDALDASANTPLPAGYSAGTSAHHLIAKLVPATTLDDLPSEQEQRDLASMVRAVPSRTRWPCRAIEETICRRWAPANGGATGPSDPQRRYRIYRREAWRPRH